MVKNLPANEEMWVRSLGGEDPLEKEMAPRGALQSMGLQRAEHDSVT